MLLEDISKLLERIIYFKDPYTLNHSKNVSRLAVELGRELNLNNSQIKDIRIGALLHDIGKVAIPEYIINKTSVLSPAEYDIIKKHPIYGLSILKDFDVPETVLNCIKYHHESYDGKGYPFNLKGMQIPLEARIVTLADHFDALTSKRAYRRRYLPLEAIDIMKKQSYKYDPEIFDIFIERILRTLNEVVEDDF